MFLFDVAAVTSAARQLFSSGQNDERVISRGVFTLDSLVTCGPY